MSEQLHPDIDRVILSEEDIKEIVARLGKEISEDYADKNPLIIAVLRGAFVFMADFVRAIDVPCTMDFMAVSSYGSGTKSSGRVRIVKDLDTNIEGRHVIIAEDILDSGLTLSHLMPAVAPTYVGTHVPDEFIVGYGLDYAEQYRNLPYVGVLKPEVYS